jgi:hypothetical protein
MGQASSHGRILRRMWRSEQIMTAQTFESFHTDEAMLGTDESFERSQQPLSGKVHVENGRLMAS